MSIGTVQRCINTLESKADALAQRRLEEYQQSREWGGYEIPRQVAAYQGPFL